MAAGVDLARVGTFSLTGGLELGTCGRVLTRPSAFPLAEELGLPTCGRAAILLMTFLKELEDLPRRHKGTKDF